GRFVLHVHNRWRSLWDPQGRRWLLGNLPASLLGLAAAGDRVMPTHQGIAGLTLHLYTRGEAGRGPRRGRPPRGRGPRRGPGGRGRGAAGGGAGVVRPAAGLRLFTGGGETGDRLATHRGSVVAPTAPQEARPAERPGPLGGDEAAGVLLGEALEFGVQPLAGD